MLQLHGESDLIRGRVFPLQEGENRIGRAQENTIALQDRCVSRLHCVITVKNRQAFLENRSEYGTYLSGTLLTTGVVPLTDGQRIRLARSPIELSFHVTAAPEGEKTGKPPVAANAPASPPEARSSEDPESGIFIWGEDSRPSSEKAPGDKPESKAMVPEEESDGLPRASVALSRLGMDIPDAISPPDVTLTRKMGQDEIAEYGRRQYREQRLRKILFFIGLLAVLTAGALLIWLL
jgi:pSer/pThr/pTyr-binding forkhead associated (FHA) protein